MLSVQGQYEMDVNTFCERSVDVMGEESDHIHAQALTDAVQVGSEPFEAQETALCATIRAAQRYSLSQAVMHYCTACSVGRLAPDSKHACIPVGWRPTTLLP